MVKRVFLLFLFITGFIVFAQFNPIQIPELPNLTRLVKLDAMGHPLNSWAGPWSCVHDTNTALVWEIKSYVEDIHDRQCSFSWFDGETGASDGGSCFTESGESDTLDIVELTNKESRCGLATWRLPTNAELRTLLFDTPEPDGPRIASGYFPYTYRAAYWTSELNKKLTGHFKYLEYGAVAVDFRDSRSYVLPYPNAAFVRLVAQP